MNTHSAYSRPTVACRALVALWAYTTTVFWSHIMAKGKSYEIQDRQRGLLSGFEALQKMIMTLTLSSKQDKFEALDLDLEGRAEVT
jgi:hypothetical protein